MKDFDAHYDVAIIGGRPSGASLGARLGARGLRVLVVDRAELPSLPAVPSCPTIHPGAMRLLDELGIDPTPAHAAILGVKLVSPQPGYPRQGGKPPSPSERRRARLKLLTATLDKLDTSRLPGPRK